MAGKPFRRSGKERRRRNKPKDRPAEQQPQQQQQQQHQQQRQNQLLTETQEATGNKRKRADNQNDTDVPVPKVAKPSDGSVGASKWSNLGFSLGFDSVWIPACDSYFDYSPSNGSSSSSSSGSSSFFSSSFSSSSGSHSGSDSSFGSSFSSCNSSSPSSGSSSNFSSDSDSSSGPSANSGYGSGPGSSFDSSPSSGSRSGSGLGSSPSHSSGSDSSFDSRAISVSSSNFGSSSSCTSDFDSYSNTRSSFGSSPSSPCSLGSLSTLDFKTKWISLHGFQGIVPFHVDDFNSFAVAVRRLLSKDASYKGTYVLVHYQAAKQACQMMIHDDLKSDVTGVAFEYVCAHVNLRPNMDAVEMGAFFVMQKGEEAPPMWKPFKSQLQTDVTRLRSNADPSHYLSQGPACYSYVCFPKTLGLAGQGIDEWDTMSYTRYMQRALRVLIGPPGGDGYYGKNMPLWKPNGEDKEGGGTQHHGLTHLVLDQASSSGPDGPYAFGVTYAMATFGARDMSALQPGSLDEGGLGEETYMLPSKPVEARVQYLPLENDEMVLLLPGLMPRRSDNISMHGPSHDSLITKIHAMVEELFGKEHLPKYVRLLDCEKTLGPAIEPNQFTVRLSIDVSPTTSEVQQFKEDCAQFMAKGPRCVMIYPEFSEASEQSVVYMVPRIGDNAETRYKRRTRLPSLGTFISRLQVAIKAMTEGSERVYDHRRDHVRLRVNHARSYEADSCVQRNCFIIGPHTSDVEWYSIRAQITSREVLVEFCNDKELYWDQAIAKNNVWGPRYSNSSPMERNSKTNGTQETSSGASALPANAAHTDKDSWSPESPIDKHDESFEQFQQGEFGAWDKSQLRAVGPENCVYKATCPWCNFEVPPLWSKTQFQHHVRSNHRQQILAMAGPTGIVTNSDGSQDVTVHLRPSIDLLMSLGQEPNDATDSGALVQTQEHANKKQELQDMLTKIQEEKQKLILQKEQLQENYAVKLRVLKEKGEQARVELQKLQHARLQQLARGEQTGAAVQGLQSARLELDELRKKADEARKDLAELQRTTERLKKETEELERKRQETAEEMEAQEKARARLEQQRKEAGSPLEEQERATKDPSPSSSPPSPPSPLVLAPPSPSSPLSSAPSSPTPPSPAKQPPRHDAPQTKKPHPTIPHRRRLHNTNDDDDLYKPSSSSSSSSSDNDEDVAPPSPPPPPRGRKTAAPRKRANAKGAEADGEGNEEQVLCKRAKVDALLDVKASPKGKAPRKTRAAAKPRVKAAAEAKASPPRRKSARFTASDDV
ncbi:hypothetical protein CDD81_8048 [Ophiocordyceps australis]|uniref:Uncharacterized protein n=1 Tax=Ophiocordyceps australis TaxID=1399860 RepID=A0A2C5Y226_9HYPO|nr:hypothetical protein CDD81_8048 [Ophiocordyceps australis]